MQAEHSSHQDLPAPLISSDGNTLASAYSSAMIDRTDDWGRRRLMAVVSARTPVGQQSLNANSLLDDISASFFSSPLTSVDDALTRAVEMSISAATSRRSTTDQDADFGIAAGAIEGDRLLIAVKSPCLATLRQDSETFLLPSAPAGENDQNRGISDIDGVEILETKLSIGDHFALLATMEPVDSEQWSSRSVSADLLEKAAGPNGSFVWMEVAEDEPLPIHEDNQAHDQAPAGGHVTHADPAIPLASMWEKQTSRGPGLFQRPPGADALRRYRTTSRRSMPDSFRSRMPRGVPSMRSIVLILVIAAIVVSAGVVAAQRRPVTTYPVGATAGQYSDAVAGAIAAEDADLVTALLPGAHTLLERAASSGSEEEQVVSLRIQVVAANDYLNSVVRMVDPYKIGQIPEALQGLHPRLIQAAGVLYLVAGDIFVFDASSRQLVALQEFVNGEAAGSIANGAGDISTLAVTSNQATYFLGDSVGGSATVIPVWPRDFGVEDAFSSVFRGRLYLLDRETAEIVVIDPATGDSTEWISPESEVLPSSPLGMVINGGIHVLYETGQLYSLYEGFVTDKVTPDLEPVVTQPLAMALGDVTGTIYVADLGVAEGRLIAYDSEKRTAVAYQLGPDEGGHLDGDVHLAFANMSHLLVSESEGAIYWIADGAIWHAQLTVELPSADQET